VVFAQHQHLSEAVAEVKAIAREQGRWIELYSALAVSRRKANQSPIGGTAAIAIDQDTYEACVDARDYRARS
jgi:hypothetical protein